MSQLPGLMFGSGVVLAAPQPSSGNPAANPTPLGIGVLQNAKLTLGADIKALYGISQWAVDTAIGKRTIKGSFEFAQISNLLMSQLFFGDAPTAGDVSFPTFPGEAHSVPATSTYTVTVTNAAKIPLIDYGVTYQATGIQLTAVASVTAAGQYSVNLSTGVYTFFSTDASAAVWINYSWVPTPAAGTTLAVQNHAMGYGPIIGLNLVFPYEGGGLGFYLPNVRLGKIEATTKQEDYTMYSTDFEGFAGPNGVPFQSFQAF